LIDEVAGLLAGERLKEISVELAQLKVFLEQEPANQILINLLERERKELIKEFIRAV
jgi:hypothetical protein